MPRRPGSAVTTPWTVTCVPAGIVRAVAIVGPLGAGVGEGVGLGPGAGGTVGVGVGSGAPVGEGVGVGTIVGVGVGGGATCRSPGAATKSR